MSNKENIRNKSFKSVKDKLEFIQKECYETELFDDLAVLFKNKGFNNVRITHGNKEFGKDLVFSKFDEIFEEEKWFAVIVKNKPAKQNDFIPGNEIANQIELALKEPYKDPKGNNKIISSLFIVINGNVTENASQLISKFVPPVVLPNIKIIDYQELREQIEKFSKDSFLDNIEPSLNLFITEQIKNLSDISQSNSVFDLKTDDINQIFVNVQTTYSRELRKMNNYVSFDKNDKKYLNEDIEGSNEILNSNENFIIHGIPTSGKTLFLKRIGIKALQQESIKPTAAFYFDLQNLKSDFQDINSLIQSQYKSITKNGDFKWIDYSKIILLFDSIDFIQSKSVKEIILSKIENFISNTDNKNYQIVIATREIDFIKNNKGFKKFNDTELLPFNLGQALQLVKKIIPNNEQKSNNFLKAIKNSMLNTSLQRTPLALTLLAILYRDDNVDLKELPANIFALYNRFTDVYLDKWDTSKGISQLYKYEQTKNILAFIAFHIHKKGANSILYEDLKNYLTLLRTKYNYDELNDIENFMNHLKIQNGIFAYDYVNNSFGFFNHYFQEYFASLCIEDDDDNILIDKFFDSWWGNSIVFYCGKKPKSFKLHKEIVNKIIPLDSVQKLYYINQHSKCLQASHSISIENRTKIVNKLLFEFDNFFKSLLIEGTENKNSIITQIPFVSILSQSKTIFESVFNSKHISTAETISLFENFLFEDNSFTNITNYNIAYFLAHNQSTAVPFEIFAEKVKNDVVWSRIIYVDVNFLNLKKKIDEKKFVRIKRKMNNNKFLIQKILNDNIIEKNKKIE